MREKISIIKGHAWGTGSLVKKKKKKKSSVALTGVSERSRPRSLLAWVPPSMQPWPVDRTAPLTEARPLHYDGGFRWGKKRRFLLWRARSFLKAGGKVLPFERMKVAG